MPLTNHINDLSHGKAVEWVSPRSKHGWNPLNVIAADNDLIDHPEPR